MPDQRKPNPLDAMTWQERFMFAFHAIIVLEGKYEDALAELEMYRSVFQPPKPVNAFDEQKAEQLRKQGMTYRAIARYFGVTQSACYYLLRRRQTRARQMQPAPGLGASGGVAA